MESFPAALPPDEPSTRGDTPCVVRPEDLPESAREIADVIGLPETLRLIDALGGVKFPVPVQPRVGALRYDTLLHAVGEHAARQLIERYAGEELYIPSCRDKLRAARDRAIVAGLSAGVSVWDLARKYRISERTIYLIKKRVPRP